MPAHPAWLRENDLFGTGPVFHCPSEFAGPRIAMNFCGVIRMLK
jgi:hypothetical protein